MKIKDIPEQIKKIALQRQVESGQAANEDVELIAAFSWIFTIEDYDIWQQVNNGDFEPFYKFHSKKF